MAFAPATASASHFVNSTKECTSPGVCVLTIGPLTTDLSEVETITVELDPGTTGATFQGATRTGGDCPPTDVSLVGPTSVHLDPSATCLSGAR